MLNRRREAGLKGLQQVRYLPGVIVVGGGPRPPPARAAQEDRPRPQRDHMATKGPGGLCVVWSISLCIGVAVVLGVFGRVPGVGVAL